MYDAPPAIVQCVNAQEQMIAIALREFHALHPYDAVCSITVIQLRRVSNVTPLPESWVLVVDIRTTYLKIH